LKKNPGIKYIFRKATFKFVQPNDIIKLHFFGRKFVVDSITDMPRSVVELVMTTLNGKKTYKGYLITKWCTQGGDFERSVYIGKEYWPREPLAYKEDKLYLIRNNE
jgi:hypothetical protein